MWIQARKFWIRVSPVVPGTAPSWKKVGSPTQVHFPYKPKDIVFTPANERHGWILRLTAPRNRSKYTHFDVIIAENVSDTATVPEDLNFKIETFGTLSSECVKTPIQRCINLPYKRYLWRFRNRGDKKFKV